MVEGNYIGTTADGMARYSQQIGPGGVEVRDARDTTIRGNLIAGLRTVGINHYAGQVFGVAVTVNADNANIQDTVIEGNTIGLAADGVTPIVTRSGIVVSPPSGVSPCVRHAHRRQPHRQGREGRRFRRLPGKRRDDHRQFHP